MNIPTAQELFDKMVNENDEVTSTDMMIEFAKLHVEQALKAVNHELIKLYWEIGKHIITKQQQFTKSFLKTDMPKIKVGDTVKLHQKISTSAEATAGKEEVENVLLQIRKNKAHFDYHKNNPDEKEHNHSNLDLEKEENLPVLDDEFAKLINFQRAFEGSARMIKIGDELLQEILGLAG
jgi:hypothetical protein